MKLLGGNGLGRFMGGGIGIDVENVESFGIWIVFGTRIARI